MLAFLLGACAAPTASERLPGTSSAQADDLAQLPGHSQERARTGEWLATPPASLPPTTQQSSPAP